MTISEQDLRRAIQAKSDQINAVDLAGGPLVCQILDVTRGDSEQPVSIKVDAHPQPWKPSKTSLRVLCACWGNDPAAWIGRYAVLYNDESVTWAGAAVGGIRTSHLSHIDGRKVIMVNATRGKKAAQTVEPYYPEQAQAPVEPQFYPDDKFAESLPKWIALLDAGTKTAEQIIVAAEARGFTLTSGQKSRLKPTPAPEPEVPAHMQEAPPTDDDPFAEDEA